ncbi:DUF3054 domain-containing protein [Nocardia sp. NPDC004068]|uniref:DUF3054 domain-containing protein n=1 Tax=Nocardia sp. NPDC004068 TaxID=3364303 RepID=UPI003696BF3F
MTKLVPLALDALLVLVFCAIGRRSHDEAVLPGLLRTFWPFASGLLLGWLLALWLFARAESSTAARGFEDRGRLPTAVLTGFDARRLWPTGVVVWLGTLIGGMVLRAVSGQGVAVSFVIVAAVVLGFFLLGWRGAWKALS